MRLLHELYGGGFSKTIELTLEEGKFSLSYELIQMGPHPGSGRKFTLAGTYTGDNYKILTVETFDRKPVTKISFELIQLGSKQKLDNYDPIIHDVYSMHSGCFNDNSFEFDAILSILNRAPGWITAYNSEVLTNHEIDRLEILKGIKMCTQ